MRPTDEERERMRKRRRERERPRLTILAEVAQIVGIVIAAFAAGAVIQVANLDISISVLPRTLPGFLLLVGLVLFCFIIVLIGFKGHLINSPLRNETIRVLTAISILLMTVATAIYIGGFCKTPRKGAFREGTSQEGHLEGQLMPFSRFLTAHYL